MGLAKSLGQGPGRWQKRRGQVAGRSNASSGFTTGTAVGANCAAQSGTRNTTGTDAHVESARGRETKNTIGTGACVVSAARKGTRSTAGRDASASAGRLAIGDMLGKMGNALSARLSFQRNLELSSTAPLGTLPSSGWTSCRLAEAAAIRLHRRNSLIFGTSVTLPDGH